MLFSSFPYVFCFLPIVVALTLLVRKIAGLKAGPRAAQAVVLLASLFFYTWWEPIHLPYLLGSILVNWFIARRIGVSGQQRKRSLQLGLVLNIGFLCVFKYVNFFQELSAPYLHSLSAARF
jgi:alginate O-acetyltransferase complex protein AlgI